MRMMLLDVDGATLKEVNAPDYEKRCELLQCDSTCTCHISIGEKTFFVISDDCATFVQNPKVSMISQDGDILLYGNLLVTGADDEEGDYIDLTDEEIEVLKNCVRTVPTPLHPEGCFMLTDVEYGY